MSPRNVSADFGLNPGRNTEQALLDLLVHVVADQHERLQYVHDNLFGETLTALESDLPTLFSTLSGYAEDDNRNAYQQLFAALPADHPGTRYLKQYFNGKF